MFEITNICRWMMAPSWRSHWWLKDIFDFSGHSISLSLDSRRVTIGTPYNDEGEGYYTGHALICNFVSGIWLVDSKICKWSKSLIKS